ncbi:MAG: hypothetical protein ACI8ZM_000477 [Crocinitomix sp.]|jgi:hypothetical protein
MKKALIIGVNHYHETIPNLDYCNSSADNIAELLSKNEVKDNAAGEPNFDCKVLTSSDNKENRITRSLIKKNCQELFEDEEADIALLYFSGYGFEDGMDSYLVTQDSTVYAEGLSLNDIMIYANNSNIKEINIILDLHYDKQITKTESYQEQFVLLRKGVSVLSAKTFHNNDVTKNLFAELLDLTLKGGNTDLLGNVTLIELYEQTEPFFKQKGYEITFKSSASRLTVLRKTIPKIPYEILRKIVDYFPTPHYYYRLDKEHVPSQKLGKLEKQKDYKNLQKMVKIGLVKPINSTHFYYAAINGKHCGLTKRGQQYWELLKKNRI